MLSHDLRNPLSAILLNTGFILRNFKRNPQLTDNARELEKQIESMHRSAQKMNRMISDFLDLARLESGKLVIEKRHYRVPTLIQEAIEKMTPLALEKSIRIETNSEVLPLSALLDREKILQVFSNLLGNAIKHTPSEGQIRVGTYLDQNELVFVVQDSGSQNQERGSAGMGLSLSKGIVEAHGGKIWTENTPGEGSTFCFSLPHVIP